MRPQSPCTQKKEGQRNGASLGLPPTGKLAIDSVCICPDCYACRCVAYGHFHGDFICYTNPDAYADVNYYTDANAYAHQYT